MGKAKRLKQRKAETAKGWSRTLREWRDTAATSPALFIQMWGGTDKKVLQMIAMINADEREAGEPESDQDTIAEAVMPPLHAYMDQEQKRKAEKEKEDNR